MKQSCARISAPSFRFTVVHYTVNKPGSCSTSSTDARGTNYPTIYLISIYRAAHVKYHLDPSFLLAAQQLRLERTNPVDEVSSEAMHQG